MYYHSTRNNNEHFSASEAILKGLADDGGLFVPSELPNIANRMDELAKLPYAKLCHQIICEFFEEFKDDKIFEADIIRAYDKFDSLDILELKELDGVSYMELYHGPTCAFKDFALSVLPYEIMAAKRNTGRQGKFAILTATSGDTGKAALEAFRGLENFKIAVVYPKNGVSKIQEMQMNSTAESNTYVFGLDGNFDDCQTLVKNMLAEHYEGIDVSSANSINIGRLVPHFALQGAGRRVRFRAELCGRREERAPFIKSSVAWAAQRLECRFGSRRIDNVRGAAALGPREIGFV